jgi:hypothetical protein
LTRSDGSSASSCSSSSSVTRALRESIVHSCGCKTFTQAVLRRPRSRKIYRTGKWKARILPVSGEGGIPIHVKSNSKAISLRNSYFCAFLLVGIAWIAGYVDAPLAQSLPAANQPTMTLARAVAFLQSSGSRVNGNTGGYMSGQTTGDARVTGMQYEANLVGGANTGANAGTTACSYAANPEPKIESYNSFVQSMTSFGQTYPSSVELHCHKGNGRLTVWGSAEFTASFMTAWRAMQLLGAPESDAEHVRFETALLAFQAKSVGPDIAENVRMHRVLAEAAVREARLWKAVEEFEQGLALSPWWPQGNYNVALIYAELQAYPRAMRYMQRYIKLVPDAVNARAAQDKIYEWTAAAKTPGR